MDDYRSTLERELERLSPPRVPIDQLRRRRDRKDRDQRIRAGVLGLAIAIAVAWWGIEEIRSTPVPAGPPEPPAADLGIFAPVAGHIVYGDRNGIWEIDPTAADGAAPVQLTSDPSTPLGWSRDGTELLIMRMIRGERVGAMPTQSLSILHADGTETSVTTDAMTISGAAIAPDGSRVVFAGATATADGECCSRWTLYAVDADGGAPEVLLESQDGSLYDPTFSPDGTQIAYDDGAGDHSHHVWVINADGSDAHEIVFNATTDAAGHVRGIAWSPAGDRIALGLDSGGIYTFAPDGSDFTHVISTGDHPYWSPDGSQIAYSLHWPYTDRASEFGPLAIADADGSNVREFGFAASGPWHPGRIPS